MYKYAILRAQTICTSVTIRATGSFFLPVSLLIYSLDKALNSSVTSN